MYHWKGIAGTAAASLFLHLLHWLIYEYISFPAVLLFFTPLLLCAAYHAVQSDSNENRRMSRRQFFCGAVLIPLLLSMILSLALFLHDPDMGLYHAASPETISGLQEITALFAGRIFLTSFYLLIFSAIDIPLLHLQESRREK